MPSILATFRSLERARETEETLRKEGYKAIQIDILGTAGVGNEELNAPGTAKGPSLSPLTLRSDDEQDPSAGVLLAANPDASGLSSGEELFDAGKEGNVLMTVVTEQDKIDNAVKIIKNKGGWV